MRLCPEPRIEILTEKKLVGLRMKMSLLNNTTGELWKKFMSRKQEIANALSSDLISLNVYPAEYFEEFSPTTEFEKYALSEVSNFRNVPDAMETFNLPSGLYAIFGYKGSSKDTRIFQDIYGEWLPSSIYLLDDRPHFEILGVRYRNESPDSEEEICIPIRQKGS
jgi:AraC family transcriptional regulator